MSHSPDFPRRKVEISHEGDRFVVRDAATGEVLPDVEVPTHTMQQLITAKTTSTLALTLKECARVVLAEEMCRQTLALAAGGELELDSDLTIGVIDLASRLAADPQTRRAWEAATPDGWTMVAGRVAVGLHQRCAFAERHVGLAIERALEAHPPAGALYRLAASAVEEKQVAAAAGQLDPLTLRMAAVVLHVLATLAPILEHAVWPGILLDADTLDDE